MTARFRTLDELPLFASEEELATALMGTGKRVAFRQIVPLLEGRGFPKIDGLMGGRYVPAVRAFFDQEYRIHSGEQISKPHSPAMLGTWKKQQRRGKDNQ